MPDRPARESPGWIPPIGGKSWLLEAFLISLVVSAAALLALASVEPRFAAMRFRAVRLFESHRQEIAVVGVALLVSAGVVFLMTRW